MDFGLLSGGMDGGSGDALDNEAVVVGDDKDTAVGADLQAPLLALGGTGVDRSVRSSEFFGNEKLTDLQTARGERKVKPGKLVATVVIH